MGGNPVQTEGITTIQTAGVEHRQVQVRDFERQSPWSSARRGAAGVGDGETMGLREICLPATESVQFSEIIGFCKATVNSFKFNSN